VPDADNGLGGLGQDYVSIAERSVETPFRLIEAGERVGRWETTPVDGDLIMRGAAGYWEGR